MADFPCYHRIADDENLASIAVLYYADPGAWVYIKRANQELLGDDWEDIPKDNLLLIPALKEKAVRVKIPAGGCALIGEELPAQGGHKFYELVKSHYGDGFMYHTVRETNPGPLTPGREVVLPAQINPANLRRAKEWRRRG